MCGDSIGRALAWDSSHARALLLSMAAVYGGCLWRLFLDAVDAACFRVAALIAASIAKCPSCALCQGGLARLRLIGRAGLPAVRRRVNACGGMCHGVSVAGLRHNRKACV